MSFRQSKPFRTSKETQAYKEAPLLEKHGNYLLFLKHTNEGHFLILGGYQGVGKIENDTLTFVVKNDEISKELSVKSFTSVNSMLTEQTEVHD